MSPGEPATVGRLRCAVLHEVAGHPVVPAGRQVLHGLAEVAAQQRGSALAGRTHQHHREALIESHGHQRRLAVARHAFNADVFGIDSRVGLEIIEPAARAPCPCPQRAPVFRLARLPFVHQPDDAAREAGAVVRLHAGGIEQRKSPAGRDELPLVGRVAVFIHLRERERRGLHRLPCGMLLEDFLQRWVLLDEHRLPCLVDAVELLRRGLVGIGETGAARTSSAPAPGPWPARASPASCGSAR